MMSHSRRRHDKSSPSPADTAQSVYEAQHVRSKTVKESNSNNSNSNMGNEQKNAPVSIETVLRIRPPLNKKERQEATLLRHCQGEGGRVVLHPLPPSAADDSMLSPSSQLVQQNHHPLDQSRENGKEKEFNFDTVFPAGSSQDKVYFSLGHAVAQRAMGQLKQASYQPQTTTARADPTPSHLIVAAGLAGSGKTYSTTAVSHKRSTADDSLLPRVMDSLFRQAQHHLQHRAHCWRFGVRLTTVEVTETQYQDSSKVEFRDLSCSSGGMGVLSSPPGRGLLSSLTSPPDNGNRSRTANAGNSPYSNLRDASATMSQTRVVSVEQDPESSDCHLVNEQVRVCSTAEEGRLALFTSMNRRRKRRSSQEDSHVYCQIQPVIRDTAGNVILEGGRIAILDMASLSTVRRTTSSKSSRIKDSVPMGQQAHGAVVQCLRSLVRSDCPKVPYLQHKVTMLIQPLFSARQSRRTCVTLFCTAASGHTDAMDNKEFLTSIQQVHRPPPTALAVVGTASTLSSTSSSTEGAMVTVRRLGTGKMAAKVEPTHEPRTTKNRSTVPKKKKTVPRSAVQVMPLEESSIKQAVVVALPPPVAPGYQLNHSRVESHHHQQQQEDVPLATMSSLSSASAQPPHVKQARNVTIVPSLLSAKSTAQQQAVPSQHHPNNNNTFGRPPDDPAQLRAAWFLQQRRIQTLEARVAELESQQQQRQSSWLAPLLQSSSSGTATEQKSKNGGIYLF